VWLIDFFLFSRVTRTTPFYRANPNDGLKVIQSRWSMFSNHSQDVRARDDGSYEIHDRVMSNSQFKRFALSFQILFLGDTPKNIFSAVHRIFDRHSRTRGKVRFHSRGNAKSLTNLVMQCWERGTGRAHPAPSRTPARQLHAYSRFGASIITSFA